MSEKKPYKCPICNGAGELYPEWVVNSKASYEIKEFEKNLAKANHEMKKCHACVNGILWG